MPISAPGPLTTLITPGGTTSAMTSQSFRIDHGVGLAGLSTDAVAGGQRRRELPRRHQQREVERDDLADDAQRLAEVVGVGLVVDLGDASPPRPGPPRRSSGSGRRPAVGRRSGSRGQACRSPSFRRPPASRGSPRSRRRSRPAPQRARRATRRPTPPWRRGRRRAPARCRPAPDWATSQNGSPVAGVRFSRYSPVGRGDPVAADEVVVALLELDDASRLARGGVRGRRGDGGGHDAVLQIGCFDGGHDHSCDIRAHPGEPPLAIRSSY